MQEHGPAPFNVRHRTIMNLSASLVDLVRHHRGSSEALDQVLRALPTNAWRADQGKPCMLEALVMNRPSTLTPATMTAWCDRMVWLFTERASPSANVCRRLMQAVLDLPSEAQPMIEQVWGLTQSRLRPDDRLPLLNLALAAGAAAESVRDGLLAMPGSADLSRAKPEDNPFTYVKTVVALDGLLAAGFDPLQAGTDGVCGLELVQNRPVMGVAGFGGQAVRSAVVRELNQRAAQSNRPPMEQLQRVLKAAQSWRDADAWMKAFGPSWTTLRDDHGNTVLHRVLHEHPEWVHHLLRRCSPIAPRPENRALWSTLNHHGEHALSGVCLRMDGDAFDSWWNSVLKTPEGAAAIETLPIYPDPEGAMRALMIAARRHQKPLPTLTGSALWDQLRRQGGMGKDETRAYLLKNPHWQQAFEMIAWACRAPSSQRAWAGLTGWMNGVDHPWVQGFRLLEAGSELFRQETLDRSPHLQEMFANRLALCQDLIDQGAPWDWANDKVQRKKITVPNESVWAELGRRWEARHLHQTLQTPPDEAARPRPRL